MDNWACKPLKMELFHPTKSLVTLGPCCGLLWPSTPGAVPKA